VLHHHEKMKRYKYKYFEDIPLLIKFLNDYIPNEYILISVIKIEFNYCTNGREWWFSKKK